MVKDYDSHTDGRIHHVGTDTNHDLYTEMLKKRGGWLIVLGVGITIHAKEDLAEVEGCVRIHGKTPIQLCADTGMLGEDVVTAHCIYYRTARCLSAESKI